jgi:hypothetical protein
LILDRNKMNGGAHEGAGRAGVMRGMTGRVFVGGKITMGGNEGKSGRKDKDDDKDKNQ